MRPTWHGLWAVADMDRGIVGVFHTKKAAIESRCNREDHVVRVHRYGPGSYDVAWHYRGFPEDGDDFFVERLTLDNIRAGGWEGAVEAWEAAGCPIEPFLDPDIA